MKMENEMQERERDKCVLFSYFLWLMLITVLCSLAIFEEMDGLLISSFALLWNSAGRIAIFNR
jgi:hypothetical protein